MIFKDSKIIALISVLIIIIGLIFGWYHYKSSSNEICNEDIEKYGEEYLENYKNQVERIDEQYRSSFPFYNNYPYKTVGYISSVQGSAIEFVPSEKCDFNIIYTNKSIENYFINFPRKRNVYLFDFTNVTNSAICCLTVVLNGAHLFKMNEESSFCIYDFGVHDDDENSEKILFKNRMYFKGKLKKHWTLIQAREDSANHFSDEYWNLFIKSEEFRQYCAIPELKAMIDEINHKRENGLYTSVMEFNTEKNKLIEVGVNKYHINSDFIEEMYNYEFENLTIQKKWYENYILTLFILIFGSIFDLLKITNIHGIIIKLLKKIISFMIKQWRELNPKS